MVEWTKVGGDVAVGGGVGVVDQLVQDADDKRIAEKPDLGMMSQYGTYYNYGIPILAVLGTAFGFLRGNWSTRFLVAGSQLAGRKITKQVRKGAVASWTPWTRNRQLEARQKALSAARDAKAQLGGEVSPVGIPVIANETVLV